MASKVNRNSARAASSLLLVLAAATYGCGGGDSSPGTIGAGGAIAGVGGAIAGVGGAIAGVGGAIAGVGGAIAGVGGAIAGVGGADPVGTSVATPAGGASSTDTTTAATAGGTSSVGGTTAKGGTSSAGGTTAKGGSSAKGGTSSVGGTTAKGGTSSVGGTTAKGGTSSVGGSSSTGTYDTSISTGEFSFFVISPAVIKANSPGISCDAAGTRCTNSLGGNLGGLTGADALCTKAAQAANPGDKHQWRAFLSTSTVNAKDRIGAGPWYSAPPKKQNKSNYASEGLLFGTSVSQITSTDRPGDSTTIVWNGTSPSFGGGGLNQTVYDWPFNSCYLDETGECTTKSGDSHDTNTGSTTTGTFAGATLACTDWTSAASSVKSRNGHSWCRSADCSGMNWISSNESHPCLGTINMTTSNETTGIGSGGGYGGFYCFAVSN